MAAVVQLLGREVLGLVLEVGSPPGPGYDDHRPHAAELGAHGLGQQALVAAPPCGALLPAAVEDPVVRRRAARDVDRLHGGVAAQAAAHVAAAGHEAHEPVADQWGEGALEDRAQVVADRVQLDQRPPRPRRRACRACRAAGSRRCCRRPAPARPSRPAPGAGRRWRRSRAARRRSPRAACAPRRCSRAGAAAPARRGDTPARRPGRPRAPRPDSPRAGCGRRPPRPASRAPP